MGVCFVCLSPFQKGNYKSFKICLNCSVSWGSFFFSFFFFFCFFTKPPGEHPRNYNYSAAKIRTVVAARFLWLSEAEQGQSRKWSITYRIGFVPYFGAMRKTFRIAEVNNHERELGPNAMEVSNQEWGLEFSDQTLSASCAGTMNDLFQFCVFAVHTFVASRKAIRYSVNIALVYSCFLDRMLL